MSEHSFPEQAWTYSTKVSPQADDVIYVGCAQVAVVVPESLLATDMAPIVGQLLAKSIWAPMFSSPKISPLVDRRQAIRFQVRSESDSLPFLRVRMEAAIQDAQVIVGLDGRFKMAVGATTDAVYSAADKLVRAETEICEEGLLGDAGCRPAETQRG